MIFNRMYADVPEAWPIQRSRENATSNDDLQRAALRQGAVVVESDEPEKEGAD